MSYRIDLKKFLTPQKIKDYIKVSPVQPRTITRELYSKDVDTFDSPVYPFSEIKEVTGNVPLVIRGGEPVNVASGETSYHYIEVQPIDIIETLNPVDLLNMKAIGDVAVEKIVREKINKFRKIILATIEALAAQSLSGKISYQIKKQEGLDDYIVNFGKVENLSLSKLPETLADVYNLFVEMEGKLQEKGYGEKVKIYAGRKAYARLLEIAASYQGKTISVEQKDGGLYIGNYFVKPLLSSYRDKNGNLKRAIQDNYIKMIDTAAPFRLRYLAIDDLRADLRALPIFIAQKDSGKTIELEAQSKPLTIPVPDAIIDAKVV